VSDNHGISAGGGANVTGNAVASGARSRAEVRIEGPVHVAATAVPVPTSVAELRPLLDQLISALAATGDPGLPDLLGKIGAAREELEAPSPEPARLRRFAHWLGPATQGFSSLATLVDAIQKAVHALF
jgi:hypothetical protein